MPMVLETNPARFGELMWEFPPIDDTDWICYDADNLVELDHTTIGDYRHMHRIDIFGVPFGLTMPDDLDPVMNLR